MTELNGRPAEDVTRAAIEYVDAHADEPLLPLPELLRPAQPVVERSAGRGDAPAAPAGRAAPCRRARLRSARGSPSRSCATTPRSATWTDIGDLLDHLRARGCTRHLDLRALRPRRSHGRPDPRPGAAVGPRRLAHRGRDPHPVPREGARSDGVRKGVDATFVQQIDVLPTILRAPRTSRCRRTCRAPIGKGSTRSWPSSSSCR